MQPHSFVNLTEIDMLVEARALLHGAWTQGSNALNGVGLPVSPTNALATCFCLRGACIRVLKPSDNMLSTDLHVESSYISKKITHALGFASSALLVQWNDTQGRTEKQVIERINSRLKELRKHKGTKHGIRISVQD